MIERGGSATGYPLPPSLAGGEGEGVQRGAGCKIIAARRPGDRGIVINYLKVSSLSRSCETVEFSKQD